jgi:hypothetical protein
LSYQLIQLAPGSYNILLDNRIIGSVVKGGWRNTPGWRSGSSPPTSAGALLLIAVRTLQRWDLTDAALNSLLDLLEEKVTLDRCRSKPRERTHRRPVSL